MPLRELDATPELRDDPSLASFNDIVTLAKSFKDTKAFVGNSIRPPGPDATPEARKEFYDKLMKHAPDLVPLRDGDEDAAKLVWSRLGRPADIKGYDYQPKLPDGVTVDLESLKAEALESGWTKAQFAKAADKRVAAAAKASEEALADSKALRAEWGAAYEDKLKAAAAAAVKAGAPDATVKAIQEGKLSSVALKSWAGIAKQLGAEGTEINKQNTPPATGNMTPAEAEAQIAEIMADPAYFRGNDPRHDSLVKKVVNLQKFISPE